MDINTVIVWAISIVVVASVGAVVATIIAVLNGSIRRYKQQRDEHYKQFYRIQQELEKGRK